MSQMGVIRILEGNRIGFWCPACDEMHVIDDGWKFNGNYMLPTFTPSVKVSWRTPKGYSKENPAPLGWNADGNGQYDNHVCHSWVTDGRMTYCPDSTHGKGGQTLLLMPF